MAPSVGPTITAGTIPAESIIELVGIASLQAQLSEIYERYSEEHLQRASDLDETDRLSALLDDHKVGRMDV